MSKKPIFSDAQVKEMKENIRTGEPVVMLAERFAIKYNVPENKLRSKLYNLAKRTRKIAEWNGPKQRRTRMNNIVTPATLPTLPTEMVGKKVVMYDDHIRIYF